METAENLQNWYTDYTDKWLTKYNKSGKIDWKLYSYLQNKFVSGSAGINPAESRLVFITSAGAYLDSEQQPFDAANNLGDYSIREIPFKTPFQKIKYAHEHYDHAAVNEDPQVLLPLTHLQEMKSDGLIGENSENFISFMGYQPDVKRVVEELVPQILNAAGKTRADAALLVPS